MGSKSTYGPSKAKHRCRSSFNLPYLKSTLVQAPSRTFESQGPERSRQLLKRSEEDSVLKPKRTIASLKAILGMYMRDMGEARGG